MKHWYIANIGNHYEDEVGIHLKKNDRVLSISKTITGSILIEEECDANFRATYTKDEAIELLEEAIKYIKEL